MYMSEGREGLDFLFLLLKKEKKGRLVLVLFEKNI